MKQQIALRNATIFDIPRLRYLSKDKEVSERLVHSSLVYFFLEFWKILTFNRPIRKVILYKNEIVGIINLSKPKNFSSEIGCFIGKNYWNMGIATTATNQMINFGFRELKLNKIYAFCSKDNIQSQKVLLKNKFKIIKDKSNNNKTYLEIKKYLKTNKIIFDGERTTKI